MLGSSTLLHHLRFACRFGGVFLCVRTVRSDTTIALRVNGAPDVIVFRLDSSWRGSQLFPKLRVWNWVFFCLVI